MQPGMPSLAHEKLLEGQGEPGRESELAGRVREAVGLRSE